MKKQTIKPFSNKDYFLLGKRKDDGRRVYLEDFSWDCDWYWSGGYLEVLNQNHSDIREHYHFVSLQKKDNYYDGFKKHFFESVLSDREIWILIDLMEQFYSLTKTAEVYLYGGHYTADAFRFNAKHGKSMNKKINADIEIIIKEVRKLFK